MEESSELQSEENKASLEKNKKRKLKTPKQVKALEEFYNEHKYPTEEMKTELAAELGLSEKQISGWFCHRRLKDKRLLKDEAVANGRQDRSSGVIQDRGSGLGQDSCGSSKHYVEPKEVESHGLYNPEIAVADMTHGRRNCYPENGSEMDDTSSESSSFLQDRLYPQGQDPYNVEPSRYLAPNGALPPLNPKGAINMGYKPSGYLKVKGEIEHAAITAVKKQLGRHYLEDGPLLGIEFDPLPPGAFEGQTADPVNETFCAASSPLQNSPEISAIKRQPSLSSRYDSYYSKFSSQDSHLEGANFGSLHESDFQDKQEKKARQNIKQRQKKFLHANPLPGKNPSFDLYEDYVGEASAYNSKNHRMNTKHGVEGMRSDSASNHSEHYEEKLLPKQSDLLLPVYNNITPKNIKKSQHMKSKPSSSIRNARVPMDTEERGLPVRMAKEEMFKEDSKVKNTYRNVDGARFLTNEAVVAKRAKINAHHHQYNVKQSSIVEMELRKNQRSAAEMPSSFSEDETAETSSSLDY